MVEDHAVFVVNELGFVAELDGLAEPALGDRPRIRVVQRHDAGRTVRRRARDPLAALSCDLGGAFGEMFEPVDERGVPYPTRLFLGYGAAVGRCGPPARHRGQPAPPGRQGRH